MSRAAGLDCAGRFYDDRAPMPSLHERLVESLEMLATELRLLARALCIALERQADGMSRLSSATAANPAVFSAKDRSTWNEVLTAEEVAAIFRRSVSSVKDGCKRGRFVPHPFAVQPYRWSKADVVNHLQAGDTEPRVAIRGTPRLRTPAKNRRRSATARG